MEEKKTEDTEDNEIVVLDRGIGDSLEINTLCCPGNVAKT